MATNVASTRKFTIEMPDVWIKISPDRTDLVQTKIIDDRNLTDSYVYNKAGVKRNVFSRMRKGEHPSKETALMLALALDLDYDDFQYLLSTAGYSLSTEDEKEVIIKAMFDINKGNIDDINEALYLLGYKTLRNAEE
jgi:hypothetical protein